MLNPAGQELRHRRLTRLHIGTTGHCRDQLGALDLSKAFPGRVQAVPLAFAFPGGRIAHFEDCGPIGRTRWAFAYMSLHDFLPFGCSVLRARMSVRSLRACSLNFAASSGRSDPLFNRRFISSSKEGSGMSSLV